MSAHWVPCSCCGGAFDDSDKRDLDFATDATPDEVLAILREMGVDNIGKLGAKFGTITCTIPGTREVPTMCGGCRSRGGLCLHNIGARTNANDGKRVPFHFSRPHWDDSGADDPDTCQWCLVRLLDQAFLAGRH